MAEDINQKLLEKKAEVYDLLVQKDKYMLAVQQIDQLKEEKLKEIADLELKSIAQ